MNPGGGPADARGAGGWADGDPGDPAGAGSDGGEAGAGRAGIVALGTNAPGETMCSGA
jgi:hypothetical protein